MATIAILAAPASRTGQLVADLARRRGHTTSSAGLERARRLDGNGVRGAEAIVLIPARARGAHEMLRCALSHVAHFSPDAHLLLVSSFAVGHGTRHPLGRVTGAVPDLLDVERALRAGIAPYTIVRPTWLTDDPAGAHAVTLTQDPHADGMLARADLASALVAAIEQRSARARTFTLFNEPGSPAHNWAALFATLTPDSESQAA